MGGMASVRGGEADFLPHFKPHGCKTHPHPSESSFSDTPPFMNPCTQVIACADRPRAASVRSIRSAFTLVEMLVVVAVIAILLALLSPVATNMIRQGWQTTCLSRLKNLVSISNNMKADLGTYPWIRYVSWSPAVQAGERNFSMKGPEIRDLTGPNPTNSTHVGEGLLCPAAKNNRKQWIATDRWWPHYRPNDTYARNTLPQFALSDAMLFYDVAWANWAPDTFAHFPGNKARVNVGYADGHVASLELSEFRILASGSETTSELYRNGWVQQRVRR